MTPIFYDRVLHRPVYVFGRAVLSSYFRLRVIRAQRVPSRGPLILVANHTSLLDGILIHAVTWRPLRVLVAAEWADWWLYRPFFQLMAHIPVDRERKNHDAMGTALAALERGEALAIFPEGGIQEDGTLGPFRNGAARLALATGAPIIPCAIIGAFQALPWPARFPRPRRITVRCGESLRMIPAGNGTGSTEDLTAVTERVRGAVRDLLALGH